MYKKFTKFLKTHFRNPQKSRKKQRNKIGKQPNLVDWGIHGVGADGAFEQFVDAGGGSNGGGTGDGGIVGGIAPRL